MSTTPAPEQSNEKGGAVPQPTQASLPALDILKSNSSINDDVRPSVTVIQGFDKPTVVTKTEFSDEDLDTLHPAQIVAELDKYIVGQGDAKRAVALALRGRIRRRQLPEAIRNEILPHNILMIGPTGVGKTEIARRLARLTHAPFIKVEATKFTEVGYVGRDVDAIMRDLVEQTVNDIQNSRTAEIEVAAQQAAEERIVDLLVEEAERKRGTAVELPGLEKKRDKRTVEQARREELRAEQRRARQHKTFAKQLAQGKLENDDVELEIEEPFAPSWDGLAGTGLEEMGASLADFFAQMVPARKQRRQMTVAEARTILIQEETDRLVDIDKVYDDAIKAVEEDGIVFLDEVDKICGGHSEKGQDVSGEGVQRDLLPVLEGSSVHTRFGAVRTDHVLFIAAGAFTGSRPSDLMPEFQGRFPIRVQLKPLTEGDLERILVEPSNALTKQYASLLATENVRLDFTREGLREVAAQAARMNEQDEDIGARRLFTILEKVVEDVSFRAHEMHGQTIHIDSEYVRGRLADLVRDADMRRYIL